MEGPGLKMVNKTSRITKRGSYLSRSPMILDEFAGCRATNRHQWHHLACLARCIASRIHRLSTLSNWCFLLGDYLCLELKPLKPFFPGVSLGGVGWRIAKRLFWDRQGVGINMVCDVGIVVRLNIGIVVRLNICQMGFVQPTLKLVFICVLKTFIILTTLAFMMWVSQVLVEEKNIEMKVGGGFNKTYIHIYIYSIHIHKCSIYIYAYVFSPQNVH